MILLDNTHLSLLFHPNAKAPNGADGQPVERCRERIEYLIETLSEQKTKIIIPTPVLTEFLVLAGDESTKYLNEINDRSCFKVSDYDQRAAIEAAIQLSAAIRSGEMDNLIITRSKIKFDRQIVAIARVEKVSAIHSDDRDIKNIAEKVGIEVKGVEDLPLPPAKEPELPFPEEPNNDKTTHPVPPEVQGRD